MRPIPLMEVVKAVHAIDYTAKDRQLMIDQVEFDSRKVKPGTLFVPLTGGQRDGHDFIQDAIDRGAVACLWSQSQATAPSDALATIFVDDTLQAFQALAKFYRDWLDPVVVGITGSNGKTTCKDMTLQVLAARYRVHGTLGNYNNEIGLPYTLLTMPEDTEVLVCEMGMSGFGDIALLSQLAQPDVAVITLIGESHMEFLGSRAGIAQAKLEILTGLKPEGVFIYPANEELLQAHRRQDPKPVKAFRVGLEATADLYARDIESGQYATTFKTNLTGEVQCIIPIMGSYNVMNALLALGVGMTLDVPLAQMVFQLSQVQLTGGRLEWLPGIQGAQILNDAYNASPSSMKAAIQALASLPDQGQRKLLVLGDIRELGEESASYHRDLAQVIDPDILGPVYLFGPEMEVLYQELGQRYPDMALHYIPDSHRDLVQALRDELQAGDQVLVKSSFGVDLLQVVQALRGQD